jgi:hypothetical protein
MRRSTSQNGIETASGKRLNSEGSPPLLLLLLLLLLL